MVENQTRRIIIIIIINIENDTDMGYYEMLIYALKAG